MDEVLETASVDRGRPHSFSQSILYLRVCVPRTGFDLLASGISFTLSLSKLHFRLPVFVEKEANTGFYLLTQVRSQTNQGICEDQLKISRKG